MNDGVLYTAEMLVALKPLFRNVQAAFRAEYLKLAIAANDGNTTRGGHAVGLTRHSVERALAVMRGRELPPAQAEAVRALAVLIFADVNNNYKHAVAVFRRAVAEAAVKLAPRRNWHAKGTVQPPHYEAAAKSIGVHRNGLRLMLRDAA